MANAWGYAVVQTDRAGIWGADGYFAILDDGYGTPDYSTVPSGIVRSIVRNSKGNYSIILQEAWYALVGVSLATVVPSSPPGLQLLLPQIESSTVGNASVLPISAGGPGQQVTFQIYDNGGTAEDLPLNGGCFFSLILKQSSA